MAGMIRFCRTGIIHGTLFQAEQHLVSDNPLNFDLFVTGHSFPTRWKTWPRKTQLLLRHQFGGRVQLRTNFAKACGWVSTQLRRPKNRSRFLFSQQTRTRAWLFLGRREPPLWMRECR